MSRPNPQMDGMREDEGIACKIWRRVLTDWRNFRDATIVLDYQVPYVRRSNRGLSMCNLRLELPNPFYHADLREAPTLESLHFTLTTLREVAETLGIDIAERKANCPATQQFYGDMWDYVWPMGAQGFTDQQDRVWWHVCVRMCGNFWDHLTPGEYAPDLLRNVARGLGISCEQLEEDLRRVNSFSGMDAQAISEWSRTLAREFCESPEPLDGSACVEEWDPDFDPRSMLIKDL